MKGKVVNNKTGLEIPLFEVEQEGAYIWGKIEGDDRYGRRQFYSTDWTFVEEKPTFQDWYAEQPVGAHFRAVETGFEYVKINERYFVTRLYSSVPMDVSVEHTRKNWKVELV